MLCTLSRWRISRAFDTDSPLPRSVENHLHGCPRCREHHDVTLYLKNQGRQDAHRLGNRKTQALAEQVLRRWNAARPERSSRRTFPLVPVSAAAAGLAAAALIMALLLPSPTGGLTGLNPLSEWDSVNSTLSTALEKADSPYLTEYENLKSSVDAAAHFLRRVMDVRIGNME